jgi:FHS family L-fucose permease-like MFS transporter
MAVVLGVLAVGTALFRLPASGRPDTAAAGEGPGSLALLGRHRHLLLGVLGIFCYVGAEVAIGGFLVNYISLPSVGAMTQAAAARYVALYWGGAMAGRFLGAAVMRKVPPPMVLAFNALAALALVAASILTRGALAMWAILAVGLFNSIMFPTIFALAIETLDKSMGKASGALCMAIVGGAIVPVLQGLLADAVGLRLAFLVPVLCYAYIAFYGAKGHVPADAPSSAS